MAQLAIEIRIVPIYTQAILHSAFSILNLFMSPEFFVIDRRKEYSAQNLWKKERADK